MSLYSRLAARVVFFTLWGCGQPRKPSVVELFNLRTECTRLGDKLSEERRDILAENEWHQARYDAIRNRCFVVTNFYIGKELNRNLYDAQTKEMLAYIVSSTPGRSHGNVLTDKPNDHDADKARAYIDRMMTDERE